MLKVIINMDLELHTAIEIAQRDLLAPKEDQPDDPTNYWGIEPGPKPANYPLGTKQTIFLANIINNPRLFGFTGYEDQIETTKLRVAAHYLLESSTAVSSEKLAGMLRLDIDAYPDTEQHTDEQKTVEFYYKVAVQAGMKESSGKIDSIRLEHLLSTYASRASWDDRQKWRDIIDRYTNALYGPVVKLLQDRASQITDQQAEWEQRHGLLASKHLDPEYASEIISPALTKSQFAVLGKESITPEALALKLRLPRMIAAVAISKLVSGGAFIRSTDGQSLTPTSLINLESLPLPVKLIAVPLIWLSMGRKQYIKRRKDKPTSGRI